MSTLSIRRGAVLDTVHQEVVPAPVGAILMNPRRLGRVLVNGIAKFPVWMDVADRDSTHHLASGPAIMQSPAAHIEPIVLCHNDNMPALLTDSDDDSSDSGSSDHCPQAYCDADASHPVSAECLAFALESTLQYTFQLLNEFAPELVRQHAHHNHSAMRNGDYFSIILPNLQDVLAKLRQQLRM
jgi:hypothetical protein